jgi:glycosyltransferase 2 family protein
MSRVFAVSSGSIAQRRGSLRAVATVVVCLATVAGCYVALERVQLRDVWAELRGAEPGWLGLGIALLMLSVLVRAERWRSLFSPATRPPLRAANGALLVGYFFNSILPARAGEAARIVSLKRRAQTSQAETLATVVLERLYDVAALIVLFFAASRWLPPTSWSGSTALLAAGLVGALVVAVVILGAFGERPIAAALRPLGRLGLSGERIEQIAGSVGRGLAGLRHPRVAAVAGAWTMLAWLLTALSTWLVMRALDLDLPPGAGVLVVIAIGLAMVLPAAPGALGVFEGAVILALQAYGVAVAPALAYAIALHAVHVLPFLIAAPVVLHGDVAHGLRRPRMRRARDDEAAAGDERFAARGPSAGDAGTVVSR